MSKIVPEILKDHILPFDWDVRKVWALKARIAQVPCSEFAYLLELPLWSSVPGRGMLFDTRPIDVLRDPKVSPHQAARLERADPNFPIDVLVGRERRWILDGVHRIARHFLVGSATVPARLHDQSVVSDIEIP